MKNKVLWIDDTPSTSLMDLAYTYDLDLESQLSYEEGLSWLRANIVICDAVILDVNCRFSKDLNEPTSIHSFADGLAEIKSLCNTEKKIIPWFVYTGGVYEGKDYISLAMPGDRPWDDRKYYNKPDDRAALLTNIRKAIDNSSIITLRKKYNNAYGLSYDIQPDLDSILQILESNNEREYNIYNQIRSTLDWIMKYCFNKGLSMVEFTGSNLNECSRFLCSTEMAGIIPVHIQRSIHSAVAISNEGSHRLSVNTMTREGDAPYLIKSTVYELLNIICWLKNIKLNGEGKVKECEKVKENYTRYFKRLPDTIKKEIQIYESDTFIVEQDDKDNYHCGDCMLHYTCNPPLGQEVKLYNVRENGDRRTKDIYQFFTNKFSLVEQSTETT